MSFFDNKKILVTGACGFVGTHLIQNLIRTNADIVGTYHSTKPSFQHPHVTYLKTDLTRAEDCQRAVDQVNLVFHCAASTSGAAVITASPLTHVTPNIVMNAQLLNAAYDAHVSKFLWLGSSTAYPSQDDHPFSEDEIMNGEPFEKYFCVGWMKRYTEVLCRTYGEKLSPAMTTIVLRPTNIYGPGDKFDPARSHVLPALVRKVVEGHDPVEVWGTGNDERDLIYIDDMIQAMIRAMEKVNTYDTFNIGSGKMHSVKEILLLIMKLCGHTQARILFDPSKPTTIPKREISVTKAQRILDFKAQIGLEEGLKKTIDWYRSSLKNRP